MKAGDLQTEKQAMACTGSHIAFLSSLSEGVRDLRAQLHQESGGKLWVAEINRPDLEFEPPLKRIDACLDALNQSEIFICVLAGEGESVRRGGTPIEVSGLSSAVSYFEIEVFEAAVNRVPAIFLERADYQPGAAMREFLDVLQRSTVVTRWKRGLSNRDIRFETRDAIDNRNSIRNAGSRKLRRSAGTFASALVARRGRLNAVHANGTDMLWLQGESMKVSRFDGSAFERAKTFLMVARSETKHDRRLSRLYLLFRELMAMPYQGTADPEILALWNSAFGLWSGSAAWYGLHNHLALGVIGGLWSQHLVRKRLIENRARIEPSELLPPYGSLASAYLSLARMCSFWWRWRVAGAGIELANRVVSAGVERDLGILAVRGSLLFVQGRPDLGMKDFKAFLYHAERQPQNLTLNAEANTYLGRGYAATFRRRKALSHLLAAADVWRHHVTQTGLGIEFLIKSLKHLLAVQIKSGDIDAATATAREAIVLAHRSGVRDQARQIEQLLNRAGIRFLPAGEIN